MNITLRLPSPLLHAVRADLARHHAHAGERVGFLRAAAMKTTSGLLLLVRGYQPVADEDYARAPAVGAEIGSEVFRKALQWAYRPRSALLHVHTHHGRGRPGFSGVDLKSGREFVPSFFTTIPRMPQGMLVLSDDDAHGLVWLAEDHPPVPINCFAQIGNHYSRDWRDA
ncbi:hypothetical protein BV98_001374 [Sphingobium herbicidovorans NBRC 16415]|uniref:JAB domain-containing protein n=1 Tax=Sphingobium herbicidovorans (strain ATCC 700291 / DSM 11019 / CCUG 56400 / KCTC 2939 / LMG 18315 / NBRC 16415 / MH) TaxID=1219045 RepID=A0A086PBS5_SPHHM|nr:hypothetical protein [Sphingobium herbicidovorans]KFG90843.1 hypothetical protein BV98_001374 [Sphingobium herbicidovorans NBRC 16415]